MGLVSTSINSPITANSASSKRQTSSPASSPHKHGKEGPKRRRTIHMNKMKLNDRGAIRKFNVRPVLHTTKLQINQFLELDNEITSRSRLTTQVFAYLLHKKVQRTSDLGEVLKPLKEFLLPTPAQLVDNDPSTVYYMDLWDENADSEETMTEVVEMLSESLIMDSQKWMTVVGDGKTYDHLKNGSKAIWNCFT